MGVARIAAEPLGRASLPVAGGRPRRTVSSGQGNGWMRWRWAMSRWDPFREMLSLREAMNQLLEESYVRPRQGGGGGGGAGAGGRTQSLALDVGERENAYVVTASLPGIRPEDVQVTVLGDTLTIRAETGGQQERTEGGYLLRERHSGVL